MRPKMMDIDPKMHGTNDSLIIPSNIRGDLGAFATANITSVSSGGGVNSVHGSQQLNSGQRFDEDSNISLIKVVVLGAPGVGKTSIVKRFISNDFSPSHHLSKRKKEYYPSLILNESLFELKVIDLPVVPYFPPDSIAEWTDFKYYGLRSASAYILVYDVSAPSTFQFIKTLREQMFETRDMTNVPLLVVANKMDLEFSKNSNQIPSVIINNNHPSHHHFSTIVSHHSSTHKERDHHHHHSHHQQHPHHRKHSHHHSHHGHGNKNEQHRESAGFNTGSSSGAVAGSSATGALCSNAESFNYHHSKQSSNSQINNGLTNTTTSKSLTIQNGITIVSKSTKGAAAAATTLAASLSTDNQALSRDRKEIVQLVKKSWHSTHVECSAKYNWNIVAIFRELAITLDMIANGQIIGEQKNATRKKRCLVF